MRSTCGWCPDADVIFFFSLCFLNWWKPATLVPQRSCLYSLVFVLFTSLQSTFSKSALFSLSFIFVDIFMMEKYGHGFVTAFFCIFLTWSSSLGLEEVEPIPAVTGWKMAHTILATLAWHWQKLIAILAILYVMWHFLQPVQLPLQIKNTTAVRWFVALACLISNKRIPDYSWLLGSTSLVP